MVGIYRTLGVAVGTPGGGGPGFTYVNDKKKEKVFRVFCFIKKSGQGKSWIPPFRGGAGLLPAPCGGGSGGGGKKYAELTSFSKGKGGESVVPFASPKKGGRTGPVPGKKGLRAGMTRRPPQGSRVLLFFYEVLQKGRTWVGGPRQVKPPPPSTAPGGCAKGTHCNRGLEGGHHFIMKQRKLDDLFLPSSKGRWLETSIKEESHLPPRAITQCFLYY